MSPDWKIKFLILGPGGTKSSFSNANMTTGPTHPAYASEDLPINKLMKYMEDPKSAETWIEAIDVAKVLFEMVGRNDMPLRLVTGGDAWNAVRAGETAKLEELEKWKDVSCSCGAGSQLGNSL